MKVKVINTGSTGNTYILTDSNNKSIILDFGGRSMDILKHLKFDLSNVLFGLITHEHGDHVKSLKDFVGLFPIFASQGTIDALGNLGDKLKLIGNGDEVAIDDFSAIAFDVQHDANEPLGFVIKHEEINTLMYLTDTTAEDLPLISGINHYLIEANYSLEQMEKRIFGKKLSEYLGNRIAQNHLCLEDALSYLRLSNASPSTITFIHLSGENNDPLFVNQEALLHYPLTDIRVAMAGMEYNIFDF